MRNKISTYIIITTLVMALLVSTGKATSVFALAVGPLADPVYETEILAFKEYVEQNLDEPQLDIMFFLIGGLAVAQMGAQDAQLISPYPNEENVKEWIINCGIQLYNSVIGLVPEGDYYVGIGSAATKGIPRQTIKGLVAMMMGDAVVAINYPDLDNFLEDNPDKLLLPFNADLQMGVNAVFGLNGGIYDWQYSTSPWTSNVAYKQYNLSGAIAIEYLQFVEEMPYRRVRYNTNDSYGRVRNYRLSSSAFSTYRNMFINYSNHTINIVDNNGLIWPITPSSARPIGQSIAVYSDSSGSSNDYEIVNKYTNVYMPTINQISYDPSLYQDYKTLCQAVYDNQLYFQSSSTMFFLEDFIDHVYVGSDWNSKIELFNDNDLNLSDTDTPYYQQVTQDYLFDLRGLMGDLVNYVYTNPIWDNIYDLIGNLVLPDRINVSVDLTPITNLLAPPIPVNLNEVALYTENDYIEEIKDRGRKFGEVIGQYIIFWHNSDPATCYILLGGSVVVLLAAFIGKWGHS